MIKGPYRPMLHLLNGVSLYKLDNGERKMLYTIQWPGWKDFSYYIQATGIHTLDSGDYQEMKYMHLENFAEAKKWVKKEIEEDSQSYYLNLLEQMEKDPTLWFFIF